MRDLEFIYIRNIGDRSRHLGCHCPRNEKSVKTNKMHLNSEGQSGKAVGSLLVMMLQKLRNDFDTSRTDVRGSEHHPYTIALHACTHLLIMKTSLLSALIVVNSQEPLPSFQFDEMISPNKEAIHSLQRIYFLSSQRRAPAVTQCNMFYII